MKTYTINYNTTTSFDTIVKAKTKAEAIARVKEVIGEPVVIESAWEVKRETNKKTYR